MGRAIGKYVKKQSDGLDLLYDDDKEEDRFRGAKGAAAHEDERKLFYRFPEKRFTDLLLLIAILCGVSVGEEAGGNNESGGSSAKAHRPIDALARLPCGTFMTVKRCLALLLYMAEAAKNNNMALVKGYIAQGIQWPSLFLHIPHRPDMACKMTYLPDPANIQCARLADCWDLMDGALLDPRQLTALLGQVKDLKTILERTKGKGKGKGKKGADSTGGAAGTDQKSGASGGADGW